MDFIWGCPCLPLANMAKTCLPPMGTEDDRTGTGRRRDVAQGVHASGCALAIHYVVHWTLERVVTAASVSHVHGLSTLVRPYVRARTATGSCTWPLRVNISGSSVDHHRNKKVYTRELSWHPSSPLTPGDSLAAGRADTQRPLRSPPLTLPTTTACSHPCWLGPRRDAKEQHLTQCPDMVGEARCHRGRARPPLRG